MTTPDFQKTLDSAIRHHQSGRIAEAEAGYRRVLAEQPHHAGALHLLGLLLSQKGQHDPAVELIRQANAIQPSPVHCCNLGIILGKQGKFEEAVTAFHEALRFRGDLPQVWCNLGNALRAQGKVDEAIAACRRAIELKPDYAEALHVLGVLMGRRGEHDAAVELIRRAIAQAPSAVEYYGSLGDMLHKVGRLDQEIAAYRQALRIHRDSPEFLCSLGDALRNGPEITSRSEFSVS